MAAKILVVDDDESLRELPRMDSFEFIDTRGNPPRQFALPGTR